MNDPLQSLLDLSYWFDDARLAARPRDPYLRWADLTDFRSLRRDGKLPSQLSFIVERSAVSTGWSQLRRILGVTVPTAYDDLLPTTTNPSTFATVRIETEDWSDSRTKNAIRELLMHRDVERIQLGYPRGLNRSEPDQRPQPPGKGPAPPAAKQPARVVLGVIDDGCPFAHPDLRDRADQTRLAVVWQQTTLDEANGSWVRPDGFEHGRVLTRAKMSELMSAARRSGDVDESLCYEAAFATEEPDIGKAYRKPSRVLLSRASHGGSVLTVAAGMPQSLQGARPCCEAGNDLYAEPGDAASTCPLVFVDLPREQVEISSGRWMPINALDGMRFILREARSRFARPDNKPLPVVVNLSSGSTAGAHDGKAMLERALDELLGADPHVAMTMAAGNSRTARSHARLDVAAAGRARVGVFLPPSQPFDTFVEFWLPAGVDPTKVALRVTSPDGQAMAVSSSRPEAVLIDGVPKKGESPAPYIAASLLFSRSVVQSTDRAMILLSVCGTVHSARRKTLAAAGPWQVMVINDSAKPLTVQAWVERDEVVYGTRRAQAARFLSEEDDVELDPDSDALVVTRSNTMSNISTGELVFAVGAYRGEKCDGPVVDYSGAPPETWHDKRYLPFAAKSDAGQTHPGVRVPGNRGNVSRRMNGTSVAAPQAARYTANCMATGMTRMDVAAGLPSEPEPLPVKGDLGPPKVDPRDGRKRL